MDFFRRYFHVLTWCALILLTSAIGAPSDLIDAERILSEAGSLAEFLGNSELQDRYRVAMQRYLPHAFSDNEFQARMDFLRELLPTTPELEDRLWTIAPTGEPFQLKSESVTYAKDVNSEALQRYSRDWAKQYLIESTPYVAAVRFRPAQGNMLGGSVLGFNAYKLAIEVRIKLDGLVQVHEEAKAKLTSKAAKTNADKKFYSELRASKDYRQLRSYILRRFLVSETQEDLFRLTNADAVLNEIQAWRHDPALLMPYMSFEGSRILSLLRDEIPTISNLLQAESEGEKLFTPKLQVRSDGKTVHATKSGDMIWISRPVPRKLHAIFSPCVQHECVSHSPERWLVPAISGARFWYTEKNGEVTGSAQLIPVRVGDKTYASLDLSSPDFGLQVHLPAADSKGTVATTIFSRWLAFAQRSLPSEWSGLTSGSSTSGDNGLSLRTAIHPSSAYKNGKPIGKGIDAIIEDPVVHEVIRKSPKTDYSGRMTFDAVIPKFLARFWRAKRMRQNFDEAIQKHELAVAKLGSKTAKSKADKKFFSALRQSKDYGEFRSYLMRRFLIAESQDDLFRLSNADAILNEVQSWHDDPVQLAPDILEPGSRVLSLLRDEIPPISSLLQAESEGEALFTPKFILRSDGKTVHAAKSSRISWVTRPVPRKLHAIFSPCIHKECVSHTPERWLVPAISGSRFWYTEKNGEVTGSAQLIPMQLNWKTYASLDLSSPDFALEVHVPAKDSSDLVMTTLFSRWLAFAQKSLPSEWLGILSGSSTSGDNGLSLRTAIHPSSAYQEGKSIGRGDQIFLSGLDTFVRPVIENSPWTAYSGRMIFDAVIPKNRDSYLRMLAPARDEVVSVQWQKRRENPKDLEWARHVTDLIETLPLSEWIELLKQHGLPSEGIVASLSESLGGASLDRWAEYVRQWELWEPWDPMNPETSRSPEEVSLRKLIGRVLHSDHFRQFSKTTAPKYAERHGLRQLWFHTEDAPDLRGVIAASLGEGLSIERVEAYRRDFSLMKSKGLDAESSAILHDALYGYQFRREAYSAIAMKTIDLKTLLDQCKLAVLSALGKDWYDNEAIRVALKHVPLERLSEFRKDWAEIRGGYDDVLVKAVSWGLYEGQVPREQYQQEVLGQASLRDLILLTPNATVKERKDWLQYLSNAKATESLKLVPTLFPDRLQIPWRERDEAITLRFDYTKILTSKQLRDPDSIRKLAAQYGV